MEDCVKLNFSESTESDFDLIVSKLKEDGTVFDISTDKLVKKFFSQALCQDFFMATSEEVRNAYIETSFEENKDDVPKDSDAFNSYILKTYFRYYSEPQKTLLEYYNKAVRDLNEIDSRIKKIDIEIEELRKANHPTKNQERLPILNYYLKHNKIAREEILDFLKKEIHSFVLGKCAMPENTIFWGSYPYHYYIASGAYEVQAPTMISNKFNDLEIPRRKEIEEMYESRQEDFKNFLASYIQERDTVNTLRYLCGINYFLIKRQEFIEEALNAYEGGNNIMFSSACFLIIEGILHDVCLQLGIAEADILGAGFQEKLNKIRDEYKVDINYEYYSFKFRLLRNKVAHGIAEAEELREVAELLLLDLYDIVNVTKSNRILMNPKMYFLHSALQDLVNKYEHVAGYIILSDTHFPELYDVAESNGKLLLMLEEDGFWDYLDGLFESDFDYDKAIAAHLLKKIKNLDIQVLNELCVPRFKKYHNIKLKFDLDVYLQGMLQYAY